MKMVMIVEFPEVSGDEASLLDPQEPAENMLELWNLEHRAGNLEHPASLIGAEWEGSASLSAMLHLEAIQ